MIRSFPQMSGMTFSKQDNRKLFITDNTEGPVCISVKVPEEEVHKDEGFGDEEEEEF